MSRFVPVILARLTDSPKSCSSRFQWAQGNEFESKSKLGKLGGAQPLELVFVAQNATFFKV